MKTHLTLCFHLYLFGLFLYLYQLREPLLHLLESPESEVTCCTAGGGAYLLDCSR